MKLHLDTSFLIDWYADHPGATSIAAEILDGQHEVSLDTLVETEYFAVQRLDVRQLAHFSSVRALANLRWPSSEAARLAARWLAPMDERQRRAHFADALIGAIATVEGAVLVTGDKIAPKILPIDVRAY